MSVLAKRHSTSYSDAIQAANKHTEKLNATTFSVHDESTRIVKEQVQDLDTELCTLDTIIENIQDQNNTLYATRGRSLSTLASTVEESYGNLGGTIAASFDRLRAYNNDIVQQMNRVHEQFPYLGKNAFIRRQLAELSERVENDKLDEYVQTGQTPTRRGYSYSTALPWTSRDAPTDCIQTERLEAEPISYSKPTNILTEHEIEDTNFVMPGKATHSASLRDLDVNTLRNSKIKSNIAGLKDNDAELASSSLKRLASTSAESRVSSKRARRPSNTVASKLLTTESATLADKENLSIPKLGTSVGRSAVSSMGRRLRSHDRRK